MYTANRAWNGTIQQCLRFPKVITLPLVKMSTVKHIAVTTSGKPHAIMHYRKYNIVDLFNVFKSKY